MDTTGEGINEARVIKEDDNTIVDPHPAEISQEEEETAALNKIAMPSEETIENISDNQGESSSESNSNTEKMTTNGLKITIMTSGTRGDVQPYAVLAQALQSRGHKVVLATEERMHSFVDSFGVPYAHVAGDPTAILFSKEGQQMLNDGRIMVLMNDMKKFQAPTFEECLNDYAKACEGADVIICGPLVMTQGYCLAEKNKAVWIPLILGPSYPTEEFPLYMISHTSFFFKIFNKISYNFVFFMLWQSESSQINKWRTKVLGLPAMSGGILSAIQKHKNCTLINAYSNYLIPGEKRPGDWPEQLKISGFIFPPAGMIPLDPRLEEFVTSGPPPIYLGFGSMPAPNPQKLIDIANQVTKQLQVRVVLMAGWTELTAEMRESNKSIFVVDSAPHEWLLPRCSVIVHHCGVGTTAAALRAGVPSVVCPVYLDQPYWAFRLKTLGVAPDPIPFQNLTANLLVEGIRKVLRSDYMRERAKEIAKDIAQVDGVQQAVDLVEQAAQVPVFP